MTPQQRTLLNIVAALLNIRGPWRVVDRDDNGLEPIISSGEGPSFSVLFDRHGSAGKLQVWPHWPKDATGHENWPRQDDRPSAVNISSSKPAEQIARDIERRFLPAYLEAWDKQLAQVNERNAYNERKLANIDRIAKETGAVVERRQHDKENARLDWHFGNFDKGYVTNAQVSADTMQFEVRSVPIDIGIKILNLVHRGRPKDADV